MKYRYENFGGIISSEHPPFLAFVDREYLRECGIPESEKWKMADENIGLLSAPTEVHFSCTNRCSLGCNHCYMDAGEAESKELTTMEFKEALSLLADMGVFHVALGGGEAFEREDFLEIADYARRVGLVPNLTTNGMHITRKLAKQLKVLGQINLSLDGVADDAEVFRPKGFFKKVDKAIDILISEGIATGLNCVVSRKNFSGLKRLFKYAEDKGINEIEILRYKPSGRGIEEYSKLKLTHKQNIKLYPFLVDLSQKHSVKVKIDCSFVPMMCYHNPPKELLESMCTYGCEAGNVLLGIKSNGVVSGCSFLPDEDLSVFQLKERWNEKGLFSSFRKWEEIAQEPCRSCDYLDICKGGCSAVSWHETNSFTTPDPECPFVVQQY